MSTARTAAVIVLGIALLPMAASLWSDAGVVEQEGRTYLTDRTGERWDITQAVSIGFKPNGFQFGIGRHAIHPLDGSNLQHDVTGLDAKARVIGVENGADAHAYVVRRMTLHEIANTELGQTPIAAAY